MTALLDTSVFVALEQGRSVGDLPTDGFISVATIAELHLGVLLAVDGVVRATRLRTLGVVRQRFDELPITAEVAGVFAEIAGPLRKAGRALSVMDGFIAATALQHEFPLYTQDRGFEVIAGLDVRLV